MRSSISAQSCDSVPPAPGWIATIASRSSCSPDNFIVISMLSISVSSWVTSDSISASTSSPSRCSSSSTSSSSDLVLSDSPAATRFSMRERLRPTSCAACGLSQNPGAEICRSISCNDLRAESRSKIAPYAQEPVLQFGNLSDCLFSHDAEPKQQRSRKQSRRTNLRILHRASWNVAAENARK